MNWIEKTKVIDEEIGFCGYYGIIISAEMSAKEAIALYKIRDASEALPY